MKLFNVWVLLVSFPIVLMPGLIGCSKSDMQGLVPDDIEGSVLVADDITANPNIQLKKPPGSKTKYDDIYRKTLFNPDRIFLDTEPEKAPAEPEPTPARMQIDVPNLELVGTLHKTVDKSSYAFIKNTNDADPAMRNKVRKYGQGEWIGDYLISLIESNRVTLIRGEEIAMLQLKPSRAAGNAPARGGGRRPAAGSSGQQGASVSVGQRRQQSNAEREKEEEMRRAKEMEAAETVGTRFTGKGRQMQQQESAKTSFSSGASDSSASYWSWSESQSSSGSISSGRPGCGR